MTIVNDLTRRGFVAALSSAAAQAADWNAFRGGRSLGVAEEKPLPLEWDAASGKNILWKTPLEGLGYSSPSIAGGVIYLTTAVNLKRPERPKEWQSGGIDMAGDQQRHVWKVIAVDEATGKILWERAATEGTPKIRRHTKASHANPTVATDGRVVVAWFGSQGLFVYDREGALLWKRDLGVINVGLKGDPMTQWSVASSPLLHQGRVIIEAFQQRGSFVAAFNASDGQPVWRTDVEEVPSWTTPAIFEASGQTLVICAGGSRVHALDFATGKSVWKFADETEVRTPTPQVVDGRVYIAGGYPLGRPVYCLDAKTGRGLWQIPKGGPYQPTPVVYRGLLYFATDNGILNCHRTGDGSQVYRQRLEGGFSASGIAGDGKVYFAAEDGYVAVIEAGEKYSLLKKNEMGEPILATPALASGRIYIRTREAMYGIRTGG